MLFSSKPLKKVIKINHVTKLVVCYLLCNLNLILIDKNTYFLIKKRLETSSEKMIFLKLILIIKFVKLKLKF